MQTKKEAENERARNIEKAVKIVIDSLVSHLPKTYADDESEFHRLCVCEYSEVLVLLSKLY